MIEINETKRYIYTWFNISFKTLNRLMETKDGGTDGGGRRTFFFFHQLLRAESEGDKRLQEA